MFFFLVYILGFVLLGVLIFILMLVLVMLFIFLKKNVCERSNFLVYFIREKSVVLFVIFYVYCKLFIGLVFLVGGVGLFFYLFLGMEFLLQLNEGVIYICVIFLQSIFLDELVFFVNRMCRELLVFFEVRQVFL